MVHEIFDTRLAQGLSQSVPVTRSLTIKVKESLSLSYIVYAMNLWSGDTSDSSSYEYPTYQWLHII